MKRKAQALGGIALALGATSLVRHTSRATAPLVAIKLASGALAPVVALDGVLAICLGLAAGSPGSVLAGGVGAFLATDGLRRARSVDGRFDLAFGPELALATSATASGHRGQRFGRARGSPGPRWSRDVALWTLPGDSDVLRADVWQPPAGVAPSGIAVIYLHGSSWYLFDKDVLTRPMFRHLAGRGHIVVDVAYRKCPDVDIIGMVHDAKRAVAWVKAHTGELGVDGERVVLMGASSGGQLALLAAFAPSNEQLTPPELRGRDLSVAAVVSYYGVCDLRAYGEHTEARLADRRPPRARACREPGPLTRGVMSVALGRSLTAAQLPPTPPYRQMLAEMLGDISDNSAEALDLVSPVRYVSHDAPPTLLVHGEHDSSVPVSSARELYRRLLAAGVPVVYDEFPRTEHGFDLLYPPLVATAARRALADVEHFLACVTQR